MSIEGFSNRRYLIDVQGLRGRMRDVTFLDVRPAEHFALGTIQGSKHLDVYGVSLNDTSEQPLHAFLAIFRTLFGGRGVKDERPVVVFDHESGERAARVVFWREHLDQSGAFRAGNDVRELYLRRGVTTDKTVIAVCQGGYRSASTLLALKSLGYNDVRNYVGSWAEWGNRDDCPVVTPG
jgi:3-mercaptopyruvate sulfurtransferase SseA